MSNNVRITLSPELIRNLQQMPNLIQETAKRAIIDTALVEVETKAKQNCRVKTGRLRASIHTVYKGFNETYNYSDTQGNSFTSRFGQSLIDNRTEFAVFVVTDVIYAKRMERLYPYLVPAYEQARPKFAINVRRAIQRLLSR